MEKYTPIYTQQSNNGVKRRLLEVNRKGHFVDPRGVLSLSAQYGNLLIAIMTEF
jgi:hypothetical protein